MNFSRSLLIMILVVAAATANAAPILYNINFTGGTPNPTAGSFYYDAATSTFSEFHIVWNAFTIDLTSAANSADVTGSCATSSTAAVDAFTWLTGIAPCAPHRWGALEDGLPSLTTVRFAMAGYSDTGTMGFGGGLNTPQLTDPGSRQTGGGFTVASAAVPEPSSFMLTLVGGALVAWLRRRFRHSMPGSSPSIRQ